MRPTPIQSIGLTILSLSCLLLAGCPAEVAKTPTSAGNGAGSDIVDDSVEQLIPEFEKSAGAPRTTVEIDGMTWFTSEPGPLGAPEAKKGGLIRGAIPNWPENLRRFGTGSNTWLNYLIRDACYEALCGQHPQTLDIIPGLASHWWESEDHMTMRFLFDERARWSDGKPVIPEDFIRTWELILDDTLIEPMTKQLLERMDPPTKISERAIEIKCREKHWLNFLIASSVTPLPAHELEGMTGKEYLDEYNFKLTATSGPYTVRQADIKDEESITLSRRDDWWGAESEASKGLYNFDRIQFFVVRDRRKAFDKVCKGELDLNLVSTAQWWVEDVKPLEAAEKGWLIRREIFTRFPKGFQGMTYNMRKPPLDDVRVRKALAHLYDRKTMLTKFAYDQYERLKSYYPGSDAENPENEMVEFDVRQAISLLEEAGWVDRGSDGILKKGDQRLSFTYMYMSPFFEKYLNPYQEACRKAGVELKLKKVTPETLWKSMMERSFEIAGMPWGATLYPVPSTMWASEMADQPGSNNLTGFKSEVADELIKQYDSEFDLAKRNEILRKLDAEIYKHHPYSLEWYLPCERILYWNKFGMPTYGLNKYDEWEDAFLTWWHDEEKAEALAEARKAGTALEIPPLQLRPWGSAGATAEVAQAN